MGRAFYLTATIIWTTATWLFVVWVVAGAAKADSVIATRLIPAQSVIAMSDVTLVEADIPGAATDVAAVAGHELRTTVYPGRAIRPADLTSATAVERNQLVTLVFNKGPLSITTGGRALGRGGVGDAIRVLNLESRKTVIGQVTAGGMVIVAP